MCSGGAISQHGADGVPECRRHIDGVGQGCRGLKAAANVADVAKVTLDLSQRQHKDGYASYLSLLSAEQTYQQACITLVQAQASRYADTAACFRRSAEMVASHGFSMNDHDE